MTEGRRLRFEIRTGGSDTELERRTVGGMIDSVEGIVARRLRGESWRGTITSDTSGDICFLFVATRQEYPFDRSLQPFPGAMRIRASQVLYAIAGAVDIRSIDEMYSALKHMCSSFATDIHFPSLCAKHAEYESLHVAQSHTSLRIVDVDSNFAVVLQRRADVGAAFAVFGPYRHIELTCMHLACHDTCEDITAIVHSAARLLQALRSRTSCFRRFRATCFLFLCTMARCNTRAARSRLFWSKRNWRFARPTRSCF